MTADGQFTDLRINAGLQGFPELAVTDNDTFFVSDWTGAIRKVGWHSQTVDTSPSTAILGGSVGNCLRSLCASVETNRAAAATTAPWASIWDLNTGAMDKIHSENGDKVNAVTFSPSGKYLVLGTGCYSLDSSRHVEAQIEVWSYDGEWKFVVRAALPGCCVDWLTWHPTADCLVALTGRRTQDGGYTTFLDSTNLRPERITDRSDLSAQVCGTQDWPPAVAIAGDEFAMCHRETTETQDWSCNPERSLQGACLAGEDILTTSGHFLDSISGRVVDELAPLNKCCRVIARTGGGYAGISSDGVLRVWEDAATK